MGVNRKQHLLGWDGKRREKHTEYFVRDGLAIGGRREKKHRNGQDQRSRRNQEEVVPRQSRHSKRIGAFNSTKASVLEHSGASIEVGSKIKYAKGPP